MKKIPFVRAGLFVASASWCLCAFAHPDAAVSEVLVTAQRQAATADETIQAVSVIRREDIEQRNPQSIMDLLVGLPGLQVNRNGGPGRVTTVLMRGANANQVLVLVDGLRASDIFTGEFDWNSISPEQIERIEVVRGPLTSLYGSDAVAGVIQIFTRQAGKGVSLEQTVGSYGTRQSSARISAGDEWKFSLQAGLRHTDGMQNLVNNPRTYSFDQQFAGLKLQRDWGTQTRLQLDLNQTDNKSAFDNGPSRSGSFARSLALEHQVNPAWKQVLQLGWMGYELRVPYEFPPGRFNTERQSLSWQNQLRLGPGQGTFGVDAWSESALKQDFSNAANGVDRTLRNTGVFGQYGMDWQSWRAQLALRQDHQNFFGTASTYNLGVGRSWASGWRWNASHGTAFKAPTVNDLFWPVSSEPNMNWAASPPVPLSASAGTCGPTVMTQGTPTPCAYVSAGNPALRPEHAKTTEIGLRYNGPYRLGVQWFETQVNDLIVWDSRYTGTGQDFVQYWFPNNVQAVRLRGVETSYSQVWKSWGIAGQWSWLDATNAQTGQTLDRRPKNSASLTLTYRWQQHLTRMELLAVSSRLNNSGATVLPGYAVLNASHSWQVASQWRLVARLDNVFDTRYTLTASGGNIPYANPGRSAYLTLRYSMQ